ncbi:histidine kinase [Rhizobium sp. S96]|uniref:sensor histidine kinase n=1 Tax=Rhizobium sp. S96 TaxID=3055140 RepID=UPI0025AAA357|nr:histidine kinase [Rhizobium sp. S96]MDM9622153.1 histidine kinase [Rhizobium sp. S96]
MTTGDMETLHSDGDVVGGPRSPWERAAVLFRRSRLEVQFIVIASLIVLVLMFVLGLWTTHRIEKAIMKGAGGVGAAYLQTFVEPMISDTDIQAKALSPEVKQKLDGLLGDSPLGQHVREIKIWNPDGSLFYSTSGQELDHEDAFPELKRALAGEVVVSRTMVDKHKYSDEEQAAEYIEVYAPLVRDASGATVLVGEFYERPDYLLAEIGGAWRATFAIVLLVSAPMLALLYMIVRSGRLIIDQQRAAARASLRHALGLSNQNRRLRLEAERARLEAGKLNEKILDQIGSDLHDGPIQVLTLVKLRLSDLGAPPQEARTNHVNVAVESLGKLLQLITMTLDEIRNISSGLVLPELDNLSVKETIHLAVRRFTDLTGHVVDVKGEIPTDSVHGHLNICVYRFIQEALMNAQRHAPGNLQQLRFRMRQNRLVIAVADIGTPPKLANPAAEDRIRLGKLMQKRRIRAFGGKIRTIARDNGTLVTVVLSLDEQIAA